MIMTYNGMCISERV